MSSSLFIFNPTNEIAIADGGNGYIPNRQLSEFERNLDTLPFLFAKPNDIVLVSSTPDQEWIDLLAPIAQILPSFLRKDELLEQLKLGKLRLSEFKPWGWSPRMIKIVSEFIPFAISNDLQDVNLFWSQLHQHLYGRLTALKVLKQVVEHIPKRDLLIADDQFPIKIAKLSDFDTLPFTESRIVVKAPYSSAGRGVLILHSDTINESNRQWIQSQILRCGYVMVEPFLEIIQEFSLQFKIDTAKCTPVSLGSFVVNTKGGYGGNYIKSVPVDPEIQSFLNQFDLAQFAHRLGQAIYDEGLSSVYNGYLGVDMFVCRNTKGKLFFHPCVEINIRYNMGTVAYYLAQFLDDSAFGFFTIVNNQEGNCLSVKERMVLNPPVWKNGRIKKGVVPLSPFANRNFVAIVEVFEIDSSVAMLNFSSMLYG